MKALIDRLSRILELAPLAIVGFLAVNYYANWSLFNGYDGSILVAAAGIIMILAVRRLQKREDSSSDGDIYEDSPIYVSRWMKHTSILVCSVLVAVSAVLGFVGPGAPNKYGLAIAISIMALIAAFVLLKSRDSDSE